MQTTYRSVLTFLLIGLLSAGLPLMSFASSPFYFFFLSYGAAQVAPGPNSHTFSFAIFVMPADGYTGTIDFTCTVTALGGASPLPTCSTPLPVTITSGQAFPYGITAATVTTGSGTRE